MAVSSTTTRSSFTGNGSTETAYTIPWRFDANDWVGIILIDADGNETALGAPGDYTLTGAGDPAGGEFTTTSAYADTYTLVAYRKTPLTQALDLTVNERISTAALEAALDKLTFQVQALQDQLSRCLRVAPGSTLSELPDAYTRAGGLVSFDANGAAQVTFLA